MLNLEKIGNKITTLRKEHKMTQNELADTLYVTHQAVSKWENGKSIPSIEILFELTKLFSVSIDFLLDNSDIKVDDYESLFKNYSRDVVIHKFLSNDNVCDEVPKIFYLLSSPERVRIIDRMIAKTVTITVDCIWPYLNKKERNYLLNNILQGNIDFNLNEIYTQLNNGEQQTARIHFKKGTYPYKLPSYIIRSE